MAERDVIAAGPQPHGSRPPGALIRLLVLAETVVLPLPATGTVRGTVVITTAALPGAGRGQFTVSAVITGAMPGTFYDLIGNDCSTADPLPDDVWATGLTDSAGAADLVGYAWTGAVRDRYWLVLDPSPVNPPPGLRGQFAQGQATSFPAAEAPCAAPEPGDPVLAPADHHVPHPRLKPHPYQSSGSIRAYGSRRCTIDPKALPDATILPDISSITASRETHATSDGSDAREKSPHAVRLPGPATRTAALLPPAAHRKGPPTRGSGIARSG